MKEINKKNESYLKDTLKVDKDQFEMNKDSKKFTKKELKKMSKPSGKTELTKEQALEDIDTYFDIL